MIYFKKYLVSFLILHLGLSSFRKHGKIKKVLKSFFEARINAISKKTMV